MSIVYKCKFTEVTYNSVNLNEFVGYKILCEQGRLSYVTELDRNKVLGVIKYRPTKTPLIHTVSYNGYTEERYNNNMVRSVQHIWNDQLYGEFRKYSINGELIDKKYYYASTDITNDIMNYIRFTGSTEDFKYYNFAEDEEFQIMVRYGSFFKLFDEYDMDSSQFDSITRYCQPKD